MVRLERAHIQGLVMSGYAEMHQASYLLLRIGDLRRARLWLADLAPRLTTSTGPEEERCIHVAFTPLGLQAIGVADADMGSFPAPFHEGMADGRRAEILGDTGLSSPERWAWGGRRTDEVHVLLLLFAKDEDTHGAVEADELVRLADGDLEVVRVLTPERLPGRLNVGKFGVEHFGFADGMSQPVIRGSGQERELGGDAALRNVINAGEFVLGYPNGYGKSTPWPKLAAVPGGDAFGRNGTYLVFRQLAQDVAGFRRFLHDNARTTDGATDLERRARLGAKIVGRWPSGAPLVKAPERDDPDLGAENSFGYAAWDPHGDRCPISAHIRRTNPRDSLGGTTEALEQANRHRILRRGRVYGPDFDVSGREGERERGLFFLCLNANLERQFEFIQHTWCNNPKFAQRYDELDPLIATQPDEGGSFSIQQQPVRRRLVGIPTFVTTRGGAYFFLPSLPAVRQLAALTG